MEEWRYSCTHSYPRHYMVVSGQLHAPAALSQRMSPRYLLYRILGGPQSRSGCRGEGDKTSPCCRDESRLNSPWLLPFLLTLNTNTNLSSSIFRYLTHILKQDFHHIRCRCSTQSSSIREGESSVSDYSYVKLKLFLTTPINFIVNSLELKAVTAQSV
jgi:hypothetical protein